MVKNLQQLPFGKSECIISLRLPLQQQRFVTIVSVYASTMSSSESDTVSFFADLRQVFLSIPDADKIILLNDLKTRVGKDYQTRNCLGSHGIGNANSNGLQLLKFCKEHDLVIGDMVSTEKQIQGYMTTPTFQTLAYDR